jgi:hypothetical protein
MSAKVLLDTLQRMGFALSADGDTLWVSPSHGLTEDLRARIRAHKEELIGLLTSSAGPAAPEADEWSTAPALVTLWQCRHLGATLTLGPDGRLVLRGVHDLPKALQARLRAQEADITQALRWEDRQPERLVALCQPRGSPIAVAHPLLG